FPSTVTSPSTFPCTSRSPSPWTLPTTTVLCPMLDAAVIARFRSHVHVDVALERCPIGNGQARSLHVSDQAPAGLQVHAIDRADITGDLPLDAHAVGAQVGLHYAARVDTHGIAA